MDKERELMDKLGIHLDGFVEPKDFPSHLRKTFEQIRSFEGYDFSSYSVKTPSSSSQPTWRNETKARAKRIAITTSTTLREGQLSEAEWRLRLEELVLARFRLENDCPDPSCKKRLWRSEVEVIVEQPGPISASLVDRRNGRVPCECQSQQGQLDASNIGINKIFSSRADEMVLYNPFENLPESLDLSLLPKRRPDRIVGFQETGSFERLLRPIARRLQDNAGIKSIREMVECTVLNHRSGSLLFPFLVMEAKSEHGQSFSECIQQTIFPIWKMLKIQEELHAKSRMQLEYGGPMLWYIAYRGDAWRLSGCYTVETGGKYSYEIVDLWNGYLSNENAALQLLLIIDYIFDWARDIYRPSIIGQLKALAMPMEDREKVEDDRQSLAEIATDSDIMSLAGIQQRDIEAWNDATEAPAGFSLGQDYNLELWGRLDCKNGVFRPACLIESEFQCLYVTKDNVEELYASVPKQFSAKRLAKEADSALEANYVLVSEHVLSRIEEIWTDKARPQRPGDISEENLFATIVYYTTISDNWELKRCLSCLAFDEYALNLFRKYSGRKTKHIALSQSRRLGERNAEDLLKDLQSRSIQYNLAAALSTKSQRLRTVAGTSSSNPCPTFEFFDAGYWHSPSPKNVFSKVYDWHKTGPREPIDSYIRISSRQNSITKFLGERPLSSYFPGSELLECEDFVLVALRKLENSSTKYHLCLYSIMGWGEPPSKSELGKALHKACQNDVFYITGLNGLNKTEDVYRKLKTTEIQEIWNTAREWRHEMQPLLPLPGNLEARSPNGASTKLTIKEAKVDNSGPPPKPSFAIEASKDINSENLIEQPFTISSKHSTPESKEEKGGELFVDITDSALRSHQGLTIPELSLSLPTVSNTDTKCMPELAHKLEDRPSRFSPEEYVSNANVDGDKLELYPESHEDNLYVQSPTPALLVTSPSRSTSPPSVVDSPSWTSPTGATTPSSSFLESETIGSSTKRLLDNEDEPGVSGREKKRKAFHVPDDKIIIVID